MNKGKFGLLFIVVLIFSVTAINIKSENFIDPDKAVLSQYPIVLPTTKSSEVKGVVLVDDMHSNDYMASNSLLLKPELEKEGFVVKFVSEFSTLSEALGKAHYFVVNGPYSTISQGEANAIRSWFENGSRNLIMASRGDYSSQFNFDLPAINLVLSTIGVSIRGQDDNVYTSDPNARGTHRPETSNFNTSYSSIFNGVNTMEFFGPSSVSYGPAADVLVFGEPDNYQEDQFADPPAVIYDNTDNGVGGDKIPLTVLEEINLGGQMDRVVVFGTTMWSDFDYGSSSTDDTVMFHNLLQYMQDKTVEETGPIVIELPDSEDPSAKIVSPRPGSIVKGTIPIEIEAFDSYGLSEVELLLDNTPVTLVNNAYSWDTTKSDSGIHEFSLKATDNSGNTFIANESYFVNQNFKPSASVQSKVMTYNIKETGAFDAWVDVVKEEDPDVLILVETGDMDDNNNALLNKFSQTFNDYFVDELPYSVYTLQNIVNSYDGITIMSRFSITLAEKIDSVKLDDGGSVNVPLPFLHAILDINGTDVHVVGAHLTCCDSGLASRLKEQEGMLNFLDDLGEVPIIYLGDFNSESPDDVDASQSTLGVEPIEMVVNASHPRASRNHIFADSHITLGGSAPNGTFPSFKSRIDYIFVNDYLSPKLINTTTGDTPSADVGSDHYSVDVFLDLDEWLDEIPVIPPVTTTSEVSTSSTTSIVETTSIDTSLSITTPTDDTTSSSPSKTTSSVSTTTQEQSGNSISSPSPFLLNGLLVAFSLLLIIRRKNKL